MFSVGFFIFSKMENTYGIGITNRYDLFYIDDEAGDPFEALATKKQKGQKKALILTPAAPAVPAVNSSQQEPKTKSKNSEKENKATTNNDANNKGGKDKTQGKEVSSIISWNYNGYLSSDLFLAFYPNTERTSRNQRNSKG